MKDFDEVFEYEKKGEDEDSVFSDDGNDQLINAEDSLEETSMRELDFNRD